VTVQERGETRGTQADVTTGKLRPKSSPCENAA
jgi:hypothetical protein